MSFQTCMTDFVLQTESCLTVSGEKDSSNLFSESVCLYLLDTTVYLAKIHNIKRIVHMHPSKKLKWSHLLILMLF